MGVDSETPCPRCTHTGRAGEQAGGAVVSGRSTARANEGPRGMSGSSGGGAFGADALPPRSIGCAPPDPTRVEPMSAKASAATLGGKALRAKPRAHEARLV